MELVFPVSVSVASSVFLSARKILLYVEPFRVVLKPVSDLSG